MFNFVRWNVLLDPTLRLRRHVTYCSRAFYFSLRLHPFRETSLFEFFPIEPLAEVPIASDTIRIKKRVLVSSFLHDSLQTRYAIFLPDPDARSSRRQTPLLYLDIYKNFSLNWMDKKDSVESFLDTRSRPHEHVIQIYLTTRRLPSTLWQYLTERYIISVILT